MWILVVLGGNNMNIIYPEDMHFYNFLCKKISYKKKLYAINIMMVFFTFRLDFEFVHSSMTSLCLYATLPIVKLYCFLFPFYRLVVHDLQNQKIS